MQVKRILNDAYGIQECYLVDNHLFKYINHIKSSTLFEDIDCNQYDLVLASTNRYIYQELRESINKFFMQDNIWELESMKTDEVKLTFHMEVGKYSYGPICHDHRFIKSIEAFCSFAKGVAVVENHELRFVTTHPMLSIGQANYRQSFFKLMLWLSSLNKYGV